MESKVIITFTVLTMTMEFQVVYLMIQI